MSSYFEPSSGTGGTSNPTQVHPTLAAGIVVAAGVGAWVLGAWNQIVAAGVIGNVSLVGVFIKREAGGGVAHQFNWEIGQGAAGAEVVVHRGVFWRSDATENTIFYAIVPRRLLTANARLAARCAEDGAGADAFTLWVVVLPN